ncbi:MAG: DUF1122 domain-containing protein [Deltaproteobacteria bacterium]|nr:MAG: DUF1122 domain-containing protein [Deltaproteobacteria bacterium]
MLKDFVERLHTGIPAGPAVLAATRIWRGRFPEEQNIELCCRGKHACFVKVYHGWGKHYRPWIEITGISGEVAGENDRLLYYGSPIECALLEAAARSLPPAGKIFVSYGGDIETVRALARGVPPPASRLGALLFQLGFTWFKDWYFPEGLKEGGEKLQGEKPLDAAARCRQLAGIRRELELFVTRNAGARSSTNGQAAGALQASAAPGAGAEATGNPAHAAASRNEPPQPSNTTPAPAMPDEYLARAIERARSLLASLEP